MSAVFEDTTLEDRSSSVREERRWRHFVKRFARVRNSHNIVSIVAILSRRPLRVSDMLAPANSDLDRAHVGIIRADFSVTQE